MLTPAAAHTECTLWELRPTHLAKTHLNYSWEGAAHTAYVHIAYTPRVCVCVGNECRRQIRALN